MLAHQSAKHYNILESFALVEREKLGSLYAIVLSHVGNDWKTKAGSQP